MERIGSVTIEYLANAGFLLCGGGHTILVDAVFSHRHEVFSAMPPALLEAIIRAEGPFSGVDLFLVTHCHRDHCCPELLPKLRQSDACLILPEDAFGEGGDRPEQRTVFLTGGSGVVWEDRGLRVTAIRSRHDREETVSPVCHYSYLLDFPEEGVRVLMLGDAETGPGHFREWLAGKRISAMTVNFVEINQDKGRAFLRELDPGLALLCHLPLPEDDKYHMGKLALRSLDAHREELPPCELCASSRTVFTIKNDS